MSVYLRLLGLSTTFTAQELKDAYRRKVRLHHPDMGGDPDVFCLVRVAYESLAGGMWRDNEDIHYLLLGLKRGDDQIEILAAGRRKLERHLPEHDPDIYALIVEAIAAFEENKDTEATQFFAAATSKKNVWMTWQTWANT